MEESLKRSNDDAVSNEGKTVGTLNGKSADENSEPPTKRRKKPSANFPKTPLQLLHELRPGIEYALESQSGPAHNPVFVVKVQIDDKTFTGTGSSKKSARQAAAEAVLAHIAPGTLEVTPTTNAAADTKDEDKGSDAKALPDRLAKLFTEANKKNPLMLLNEIHPTAEFTLVTENKNSTLNRFVMRLTLNGEEFQGIGSSKKGAKAAAARSFLSQKYDVTFADESTANAELIDFSNDIAEKIVKSLMETFKEVMTGYEEHAKWKVIAGFALSKDKAMEDIKIICFATGTQHLTGEVISLNGATLNDCHAEVMARRSLVEFLYTQLELHIEGEGYQSVLELSPNGKFRLKPHHRFHFFISSIPCGDAQVSSNDVSSSNTASPNLLRTKSQSGEGTEPVKIGQSQPIWQQGQRQVLTMSCSDKIASWNIVGVQGSLLSHFIEPIYFHSIILSSSSPVHRGHLFKAICGRLEQVGKVPPPYCVNKPKICVTTKLEVPVVDGPDDFSINWTVGNSRPEVIAVKTGKTIGNQVSRLSKHSFFQRYSNLCSTSLISKSGTVQPRLYVACKNEAVLHRKLKNRVEKTFSLSGLGSWVHKPVEQEEFSIEF